MHILTPLHFTDTLYSKCTLNNEVISTIEFLEKLPQHLLLEAAREMTVLLMRRYGFGLTAVTTFNIKVTIFTKLIPARQGIIY